MSTSAGDVWELRERELLVRGSDGSCRRVSAETLFKHVFRDRVDGLPELPSAAGDAPLTFSKVPLTLVLEVGFFESGEPPSCRVVAEDMNGRSLFHIGALLNAADHAMSEGVWYPYARGALTGIRNALESVGMEEPGQLTLRQYLNLRGADSPLVRMRSDYTGEVTLSAVPHRIHVDAKLYEYQTRGVAWLSALAREDLGGVLADEMGLGKTLQVIALIASEPDTRPALVVAPATLLENWRREIARFAGSLRTSVHHGAMRTGFPSDLRDADVVVTSYETLVRDISLFGMVDWGTVVIDEAQNIRNPDAARTAAVKQLSRRVSIAVTGTPVENTLKDLWSICDFAVHGFLGDLDSFLEGYADTPWDAERIALATGPFVLRRRIADVASDLPPRIDVPQPMVCPPWMAEEYESLRRSIQDEYGASAGFAGLVRLRQFCTHPFLISGRAGDPAAFSPKYARLVELLEEIAEAGEKALVFTSFTGMVDILEWDLPRRLGLPVRTIDGRTPVEERQAAVDWLTAEKEPAVLVLNPQAGGTGLNIAAANHVLHYNPEWNPATQDQASARAHRRGRPSR